MAIQCDKCRGSGLVGVGESPHLQVGPVSTCDKCLGKGVLEAESKVVEPEELDL